MLKDPTEIDTNPEGIVKMVDSSSVNRWAIPAMLTDALMLAAVLAAYKFGLIDKDMAQLVVGTIVGASLGSRIPARAGNGGPPDVGGAQSLLLAFGSLAGLVRR